MPPVNANKNSGRVQKRGASKVTVKPRVQIPVPTAGQSAVKNRGASKALPKTGPKRKGAKKERPKATVKHPNQLPRKIAKKKELPEVRPQSRATLKTRLQIPVKSPLKIKGAQKTGRPKAKNNNEANLALSEEAGSSGVQTRAHAKPEDEPAMILPVTENEGPQAAKSSKGAKKGRAKTPQLKQSNYSGVQTRARSKMAARVTRQHAKDFKQ